MRTCPVPGCGTSRSTISKSPPGLGTCTAFIGANATLVVAMLPSGWNFGVRHVDRFAVTPDLDAARLPSGTVYVLCPPDALAGPRGECVPQFQRRNWRRLGAAYRLTRFHRGHLRGWPTGLLAVGARNVHDEFGPIILPSVLLGVDGGEGAEEQIGGVGHDRSAARGDLVPGLEFIEFAEGVVDVGGGAEFLDVTDEGGSEVSLVEVFVMCDREAVDLALSGVFAAEAGVRSGDGHARYGRQAATTAAGGAMPTMERGGVGVGDGGSSLRIHVSSFPAGAGMFHFGNCWYPPRLFSYEWQTK